MGLNLDVGPSAGQGSLNPGERRLRWSHEEAMARFIRSANRACASVGLESQIFLPVPGMRIRTYGLMKSPMEANLLRILRNQIQNHTEYAPLYQVAVSGQIHLLLFRSSSICMKLICVFFICIVQPATELGAFQVTYKPREQLIELTGKYGQNEDIRIQTTTFDCCVIVPLTGEGPSRGEERHHLSLRIHITKGDGSKPLEVICSSWPDFLEVQKFWVASDRQDQLVKPYIGRYFGYEPAESCLFHFKENLIMKESRNCLLRKLFGLR